MKTANLWNIILALALVVVTFLFVTRGGQKESPANLDTTDTTQPSPPIEWQQVSIDSANINSFQLFQNAAALNVGSHGQMNSMTIGWGSIGILWGHDRHVVTVYVRKSRFTHHLMEDNDYFTVEGFSADYAEKLQYLGTASGRDEDKIKGSGMTLKTMPCGAPAFEEGNLILECKKIYTLEYNTMQMDSTIVSRWYTKGDDFDNLHTSYVGEIVGAWVKQ